jgi:putative transposase
LGVAKGIKTEKDLSNFSAELMKLVVETALGAEMEAHLGYARHDPSGHHSGNSRNGFSRKRQGQSRGIDWALAPALTQR